MANDPLNVSALKIVGFIALLLAILGLTATGLTAAWGRAVPGEVPACCLVILMVGLALAKPELLQNDTQQASTMRMVVFIIVAVFALLTTKVGWTVADLSHLTLDGSWAWVLGAALGGKALQSFSEYRWPSRPSQIVQSATPGQIAGTQRARHGTASKIASTTLIHPTGGPRHRPS